MPGRNKSGPAGMGSDTGRGLGLCRKQPQEQLPETRSVQGLNRNAGFGFGGGFSAGYGCRRMQRNFEFGRRFGSRW